MKFDLLKPSHLMPSQRDRPIAPRPFYLYIFKQLRNLGRSKFYSSDSRISTNSSKPMLL